MGQLIKKTVAAVAVDDSLTTLIDWTNIEGFSDFTIIVGNIGGGSGNDITDIQIDTSEDAGLTESLDQHAGTPVVPVTTGDSKEATFTESAAFIRVRAICAAGEDSTATAYLIADSAAARICTLDDIKDRLGITDAENDRMINTIIAGIGAIFDNSTDRTLIAPATDVTERVTGYGYMLRVKQYPLINITSIKEAWNYDFDSAETLTEPDDYIVAGGGGKGVMMRRFGVWPFLPESIQIVYRGGYCAAGVTPGTGEHVLPSDLREAAILQATFVYKRRDDIGLTAVTSENSSMQKFSAIKLLPQVQEILKAYRRPSL